MLRGRVYRVDMHGGAQDAGATRRRDGRSVPLHLRHQTQRVAGVALDGSIIRVGARGGDEVPLVAVTAVSCSSTLRSHPVQAGVALRGGVVRVDTHRQHQGNRKT